MPWCFPRSDRENGKGSGSALGKELPPVADPSGCQEAGYSGPSRHLPGDAPDAGDRHAAAWDPERHAGHAAAREYPDDGDVYVQTIRRERPRCRELANVSGPRRLENAGEKFDVPTV
jgi:hypothetical protein